MNHTSTNTEILKNIPDFTSWNKAEDWLRKGQELVQKLTPKHLLKLQFISLEWGDIKLAHEGVFGLYSFIGWRKFVLAVFLADLISYPNPSEQVDFERLAFILHAFPQGFRTWWVKLGGVWWPVGYTGWYPMLETTFEVFEKSPEKLKNRMVVPDIDMDDASIFIYMFNYSVIPQLKGGVLATNLMKHFAEDIKNQKHQGLACITVSEDGVRIAKRFGMERRGYLGVDESLEGIYTKRV